MSVNPYFDRDYKPTQDLYEDIIIESIQAYGQNFLYIPRVVVSKDDLLGEDIASEFNDAQSIEMYVETVSGYDGDELFQKFGLEIRDESVFVVAKRRWNDAVGSRFSLTRPREGDLIYVPFSKTLFEVTFVEHEDPFYQINNLNVYKLSVALFEYNDEKMDLSDDGIDTVRITDASAMELTLNAAANFTIGETITQTQPDGTVTGILTSNEDGVIKVSNVSSSTDQLLLFVPDIQIVSQDTQLSRMVMSVSDVVDLYEKNEEIETEADAIIEFDPQNPFGNW